MTWMLVITAAVLGLFLSGFFSGAETGLYRVDRLRLYLGVQRRDPWACRLSPLLEDEPGILCVTLVGTNVANYIATSAVAVLCADLLGLSDTSTEIYTVAFVTPIVFVFAEMVPKNLFQFHADTLMARGSRLLAISNRLLRITGVVWCLTRLSRAINHVAGLQPKQVAALGSKRRVADLLREALAGTRASQEQNDLIERVCQMSDTQIHSVMVPRNRVTVIRSSADRRELIRTVRRTPVTRLPVYQSDRRRMVGVVKVDTLLRENDWTTVGDKMQKAKTISPHTSVASAITELQRARRGLAIVTDRGGQLLGIVTLRDLLREVVGELAADI